MSWKHHYLQALVQWLKTPLFTWLWANSECTKNNPSRKHVFWKWTVTKPHYLHAFRHIADIVTKHQFLSGLVSLDSFNQKTRIFLPPRSYDYANLFAHDRHLPADRLSASHGGPQDGFDVRRSTFDVRDGLRIKPASPGQIRQSPEFTRLWSRHLMGWTLNPLRTINTN